MEVNLNIDVNLNQKMGSSSNSVSSVIAAADSGQVTVTPPVGYLMQIKALYVKIPVVTGAASGTHILTIFGGGIGSGAAIAMLSGAYNTILAIAGFAPNGGTSFPVSETAFVNSILGAMFSNTNPLVFQYNNNANISTANNTTPRVYAVEYTLVPETNF